MLQLQSQHVICNNNMDNNEIKSGKTNDCEKGNHATCMTSRCCWSCGECTVSAWCFEFVHTKGMMVLYMLVEEMGPASCCMLQTSTLVLAQQVDTVLHMHTVHTLPLATHAACYKPTVALSGRSSRLVPNRFYQTVSTRQCLPNPMLTWWRTSRVTPNGIHF